MGFLWFVVWVALSFVVASAARNRNRSYWGYFFFSICLSPLIAGFVVILLGEARGQQS